MAKKEKKRNKKYTARERDLSKLVVWGVESISGGVIYGKHQISVTDKEMIHLTKKKHEYHIVVGAAYRTPTGLDRYHAMWLKTLDKVLGDDLTETIREKTRECKKKVNKDDLLTTFFFACTHDILEEDYISYWLLELGIYNGLINKRENDINTAKEMVAKGERVDKDLLKKVGKHLDKMGVSTAAINKKKKNKSEFQLPDGIALAG